MKWSKELIVDEIQKIARKLGKTNLRKIDFARNSEISISAVRYHLGSWSNALEAAGFSPLSPEEMSEILKESNTLEDNILLIELLKLYYEHGKITHDLINREAEYSVKPYVKRWGSPQKALDEALKRANEGIIDVDENELDTNIEDNDMDVVELPDKAKRIFNSSIDNRKTKSRHVFGQPIDFRGLRFAPINEQGVVYLFGMISSEIGFYIESVRTGFPDCEGKRCFDPKNNLWEHVRIEFEFKSSNFVQHGHDIDGCDVIVCWQNDWKDCPIEVIELKEEIRKLPRSISFE